MVKKIVILMLIIGMSQSLQAHCGTCGTGSKSVKSHIKTESKIEKLTKELSLTKEQAIEIEKLLNSKKLEIKSVEEKYQVKINSILNEEQAKTYSEKMENRNNKKCDHSSSKNCCNNS
ncbi:MAG: hypothetical protein VW397_07685 [Candidatus Margulisiibacteriota bacterium]